MEGSERPYRLSDAERDEALDRLRTALEEGRLDLGEHEARSALAVRAVTSSDLVPLFDDLPASATRAFAPAPHREHEEAEPTTAGDGRVDSSCGPIPWHLLPWAGFIFVFAGLPAVLSGSVEAIIGWSVFFAVMVVPYVVVGVVRNRRST